MPEIYLRYEWDLSGIYLRFTWNMPEIFSVIYQRYPLNKPEICLRYASSMHDICLRHFVLDNIQWICMIIFLRYFWDWLWVKSQRAKKKVCDWVSEWVCRLEFVRSGPVEKNEALYLSQFSCGSPTAFENIIFPIAKLKFSQIFAKIANFQPNFRGTVFGF